MKFDDAVALYITLRDQKATIKAEYDEKVAGIDKKLAKLEAKFLEVFNNTGMESIKTAVGTAYVSSRTTMSVADKDAFMGHVRGNEAWELLEVRVSKAGVEQHLAAGEALPPGVNSRTERTVNVRRS